MSQDHPEPSAPAFPNGVMGGERANGLYPPLTSVPSPFPRATHSDSPREQPKYFAPRSEAGSTQSPINNGHTSFTTSSDLSSTSYRPSRSNPGPIKSEPLPIIEVTVADPRVCHEPHKVAVPGTDTLALCVLHVHVAFSCVLTTSSSSFSFCKMSLVAQLQRMLESGINTCLPSVLCDLVCLS